MSCGRICVYIHMTNNCIAWNYVITSSNLRTNVFYTIVWLNMILQVSNSNTVPETPGALENKVYSLVFWIIPTNND